MRILVYPHDLNMGGSQTNAIELAAAVSRLGHECIVFGRRGSLCARIEELGLEFIEAPDPGRRPSLAIAKKLREIVRSRDIDIIHGYEWPPGLEAVMAAEGLPDVAAVCTVMSMAVAPFLPRWLPLVVGTQQISAAEQARGRRNVNLIEPSVDLEHNRPIDPLTADRFRRAWGLDDRPLLVCVSRLVPELKSEGILTAIDVAVSLADTASFQMLIAGDGKARPAVERAAAEANARIGRPTVILTGELADPRTAYAAADIVLGMGGSALRSLAFAKPLVVQGEDGFFRMLSPDSLDLFRWQGWYGRGLDSRLGAQALEAELRPLVVNAALRREVGAYGRQVVDEFSLERAAQRQVTVYRDALKGVEQQKRQLVDATRSFLVLATYQVGQRVDRYRGRQRTDDFNAKPVAGLKPALRAHAAAASTDGPILYFPGVGWDTLAGTDRQLASALSKDRQIVWVDTPHSILRKRDRAIRAVTHPHPNVVRLRASTIAGVQRPFLRDMANRRRAQVARRYFRDNFSQPGAIIVSTTAPMLDLIGDLSGSRVYYATDDFTEAATLWNVSQRYLHSSRERNLAAADLVVAISPELARHLQRGPLTPRSLPNGADVTRFERLGEVAAATVPLSPPVAGVVGQFNSRTNLEVLEAVAASGISLLLVGPRHFSTDEENAAFDRLLNRGGVHWVDEVSRDELPAYLSVLDVGLTPYSDSMFNRRSYPLKTLEYLAAGIPVVTTNVPSTADLDERYVAAESSTPKFCARVAAIARADFDRSVIRRSVDSEGWDARAARLLYWLGLAQ